MTAPDLAPARLPDHLAHLLDRAERGVILPAEGRQLRQIVTELHQDLANGRADYAECLENGRAHALPWQQLAAENAALHVRANLRTCLFPTCLRQYDALSQHSGRPPDRPEWSGGGWRMITRGFLPGGDRVCPDHADIVTAHFPRRPDPLPEGFTAAICTCESWASGLHRWHRVVRALWEQHLLTVTDALTLIDRPCQEERGRHP